MHALHFSGHRGTFDAQPGSVVIVPSFPPFPLLTSIVHVELSLPKTCVLLKSVFPAHSTLIQAQDVLA